MASIPGTKNKHGQIVVRDTGAASISHPYARVVELKCSECGKFYGANSCDVHERRCPHCQHGRPGEPLPGL